MYFDYLFTVMWSSMCIASPFVTIVTMTALVTIFASCAIFFSTVCANAFCAQHCPTNIEHTSIVHSNNTNESLWIACANVRDALKDKQKQRHVHFICSFVHVVLLLSFLLMCMNMRCYTIPFTITCLMKVVVACETNVTEIVDHCKKHVSRSWNCLYAWAFLKFYSKKQWLWYL